MEILMNILQLLAGCGVFMTGMKLMSEGMERSTGKSMRRLFDKISDNHVISYGIGMTVTSLIQSSAATTVMAMGLVNAGIMTIYQAAAIVLGAKVGTTITGVLVAFSAFGSGALNINLVFAAVAIVGIAMMMFFKKDSINRIGNILTGFGLIFVGLIFMKESMSADKAPELNAWFVNLFSIIDSPILLILAGTVFTALIQSSSASSGIFITMIGVGTLSLEQAFFLVIGANIGTCVTALLATIGATNNAKLVAILHTVTSMIGAVIFGLVVGIVQHPLADFFRRVIELPEWQVAIFNVIYNLSYTVIMLPLVKPLVQISELFVKKDREMTGLHTSIKFIDDRILQTPQIAVVQVQKEVINMAEHSRENLRVAIKALVDCDLTVKNSIESEEEIINYLNKEIAVYLIKLSSQSISGRDERLIGTLHHVISDIERIGDHAENFMEFAEGMTSDGLEFSADGKADITNMYDKISKMFELAIYTIEHRTTDKLVDIAALEEEVDTLQKLYYDHHIERMNENRCSVETGTFFYDVISELERIGDHLVNVAFSVNNPTGTEKDVLASLAVKA